MDIQTTGKPCQTQSIRRRLHRSEEGMMTWGTILGVATLLILIAFVSNSVQTVTRKLETQNTADGVAYSSATWIARGMNALTATNHIIGELNAIYSLHHALGGKYLDNHYKDKVPNQTREMEVLNAQFGDFNIRISINLLFKKIKKSWSFDGFSIIRGFCHNPFKPLQLHFDALKKFPIADINSALYEAKAQSKRNYRNAIYAHLLGAAIYWVGEIPILAFLKPVGLAVQGLAFAAEWAIYTEWLMLEGLELFARNTAGVKKVIPSVISAVYIYQKGEIFVRAPLQAYRVADKIAKENHPQASGFVRGDIPDFSNELTIGGVVDSLSAIYPKMPVEPEDTERERRSQMIRATYPWVSHWRRLPIKLFSLHRNLEIRVPWPFSVHFVLHSRFREFYRKWTNIYTRQASELLRFDKPDRDNGNQKYREMLTVENYTPFLRRAGIFGISFWWRPSSQPAKDEDMKGREIKLFVMKDLNDDKNRRGRPTTNRSKSQERWNKPTFDASLRADKLFCLIGFAQRDKHTIVSPAFFRQENPHGFLCYSQAMIYNANEQQEPEAWRGMGQPQARVGWDTLNWNMEGLGKNARNHLPPEWQYTWADSTIGSHPPGTEFWSRGGRNTDLHHSPKVKLNWQAKLSPLTVPKMTKVISSQTLYAATVGDEKAGRIMLTNREAQLFLQNH